MLYKEHVLCKECSTFYNNPDAGIVKIGLCQSTSNLWSHKRHNRPAEFETITKGLTKNTKKSDGEGVVPTSILNMPGFTAKVKVKVAKLLYRTAVATLAIKEGIPLCTFSQPSFRQLFIPLNTESDKIVNLTCHDVRDSVVEMGGFAMEATKRREICNHQILWTTDHWTGADKGTYTTVTAHWINKTTWKLHSACLDFKTLKGPPSARESTKMLWWFFKKIRVKPKQTPLCLTPLASQIQLGIWGSLADTLMRMAKNTVIAWITTSILLQSLRLIVRLYLCVWHFSIYYYNV